MYIKPALIVLASLGLTLASPHGKCRPSSSSSAVATSSDVSSSSVESTMPIETSSSSSDVSSSSTSTSDVSSSSVGSSTPTSTSVSPGPCDLNQGQFKCEGTDLAQCVNGMWSIISCGEGTRCLENDWECVLEDQYDYFNSQINSPTSTPTPVPTPSETPLASPGPCDLTQGQFSCQGTDLAQCVNGMWSIIPCGETHKCLENDWECVPVDQWEYFNSQVNSPAPTPTATPVATPSETPVSSAGPCDLSQGQFSCQGNDLAQCVNGMWSIIPCGETHKCLENDWECVPVDQYDYFNSQVNGVSTTA